MSMCSNLLCSRLSTYCWYCVTFLPPPAQQIAYPSFRPAHSEHIPVAEDESSSYCWIHSTRKLFHSRWSIIWGRASQLRGNIPDAVDICLSSTDDYSYNKSTLPIALFTGTKSPFIPHATPLKTLSSVIPRRMWCPTPVDKTDHLQSPYGATKLD